MDFLFACLLFANGLPEQGCQLSETGEGFAEARFETFDLCRLQLRWLVASVEVQPIASIKRRGNESGRVTGSP